MAASLWYRLGCCLTGHDYVIASDGSGCSCAATAAAIRHAACEIDRDLFRKEPHDARAGAGGNRPGAGHSSFATR